MPRPYNQKTVKDALLLLDIYASNNCSFEEAASGAEVRPSSTGYRVAEHLIDKLADMFPEERLAVVSGEAAGLLREGWRIGDEIPVREGASVTLKSVDAILREQCGSGNVEAMTNAPNPFDLSSIERTTRSNPPFAGDNVFERVYPAAEVLAEPLDAVEEPTDEEIGTPDFSPNEIAPSTDYDETPSNWDTTEPSE